MAEIGAVKEGYFGRNSTKMKYVCSECLEEKPVSELNVSSDGSAHICNDCLEDDEGGNPIE